MIYDGHSPTFYSNETHVQTYNHDEATNEANILTDDVKLKQSQKVSRTYMK